MLQFSYIQEVDFSKGVDQYNNTSSIGQGFCEDILNMDVSGLSLEKRSGYEKFAGDVPISLIAISASAGTATLTLPSWVNLDEVSTSSPFWIYGKMYNGSAYKEVDFISNGFSKLNTYSFSAPTDAENLNLSTDLAISSHKTIIQMIDTSSDEIIFPDEFKVNPSTLAATVTCAVPATLSAQFVTHSCTDIYSSDDFGGSGELKIDAGVSTIAAATHNLGNQLIPMFWLMNSATEYELMWPDRFTIKINGDVEISTLESAIPSAGRVYQVFLTECPNYIEDTAIPGATSTSKIIAGAETPYLVAACYIEDLSTGDYHLVFPNSITYDETLEQHAVTFLHEGVGDFTNYKIVYAYGTVASNRCVITGLVDTSNVAIDTSSAVITNMSLSVTGLNNENLTTKPSVNFIDKYEALDETIIASGGQLYRSYDPEITETYDTRVRLIMDLTVGPAFSTSNYGRTDGTLLCSSATSAGYLAVQSILYTSGTTYRVTILAPSYTMEDANHNPINLGTIIDTNSQLTLTGSMKAEFNGDFPVVSVGAVDSDSFYVDITVSDGNGARSNDAESGAYAGIFSDTLLFQTDALFAAGDIITLASTVDCEVIAVDQYVTTKAYIKSVENPVELFAGQRLGATAMKSSVVVPGTDSELVAGDIVTVADVTTRISSVTPGVSSTEIIFRDEVAVLSGQIEITCPYRWQLILVPDYYLGTQPVSETELLRSVAGKGSLYISSGVKYDGDKIYSSGLPNLQMHMAVNVNENEAGIAVPDTLTAYTAVSGKDITVTAAGITTFEVKDQVLIRSTTGSVVTCDASKVFTIAAKDTTLGSEKYTLDGNPADITVPVPGTTCTISKFSTYRYFIRLSLLDRNGNIVVSSSTGAQDIQVRLSKSAAVIISGCVLPSTIDPVDYANLTVEIFRRREHQRTAARTPQEVDISNYYRLTSISLSAESNYFSFVDAVPDIALENSSNLDLVPDPVPDGIGDARMRLPRSASFITAANNQLVVGDYLGENQAKIKVEGSASYSDFRTKEFVIEAGLAGATSTYAYYICEATDLFSYDGTPSSGEFKITRSSGKFTITFGASVTGLSNGDWVLITRNASTGVAYRPTLIGWWQVTNVNGGLTECDVTWADIPSSLVAEDTSDLVLYFKNGKIPLVHDLINAPISASVERDTTIRAGLSLHLSQAITATLLSLGVKAFGGKGRSEYAITIVGDMFRDITVPDMSGVNTRIFCNDRLGTFVALASRTRFGSRVALSTKGFPEVFDGTEDSVVNDLPLVQDINPDDGERVRMAVPFFAAAAFESAQQSGAMIIFKDHSAYLLDPQAKYSGKTVVMQQLDTSGYGCECPLTVVNSQLGVFFMNTTGAYMINRQYQLNRIGSAIGGYLDKGIFTPDSATCAVNDIVGEKLMFTSGTSTLVMHLPENEQGGIAWTRYDSIPATMWAHRDNDFVFATAEGFVGISSERYADAGSAISTAILFRYLDAGMPTLKKVLRHLSLVLSSESAYEAGDIDVSMATDFSNVYEDMDTFKLTGNTNVVLDGLSDLIRPSLQVTSFSPATAKAGWYQLKVISNKLDAGLLLARVVYQIAAIRTRGDTQAAETK